MKDAEETRRLAREAWEAAAGGWAARREAFHAALLPVSHWMVDAIRPQPGHWVVELAAGPGDTGFLAAELIAPGGRLLCTDGAEAMVEAARARAAELGITNAEFRTMELEWLDLPAAGVDAVLCRFGYMLALDPAAALRETRRVLKPGGRAALAVWDREEHNLISLGTPMVELGLAPPPPPGAPGPFSLADEERLRGLLEDAGLVDVEVEPVEVVFEAPSLDALWEQQRDLSPSARKLLPTLSPADHTRLRDRVDERWSPYVVEGGAVRLPGRALCAAAEA